MSNPFAEVVPSGHLHPGYSAIPVSLYHDEKAEYPVAYYSGLDGYTCLITATSRDSRGINITYLDAGGKERVVNVNGHMNVFAYITIIYDDIMSRQPSL